MIERNLFDAQMELFSALCEAPLAELSGETFFEELDNYLINSASHKIYFALFMMAGNSTLILTGGFGKRIAKGIDSGEFPNKPYILFKGDLRKGNYPEIIKFSVDTFESNTKYILIDDTIYGGYTYIKIKEFLSQHDIHIEKCVVIYDGCPVVREDIVSIFRYYDFFKDVKPNFEFQNN